ncbi:MAG: hypothetical protein ACKO0M_06735 [Cyanobium sp.]
MLLRLRLLLGSVAGSLLLFTLLCLGAQNLDERVSLRLGPARSAPLPAGFVIGLAVVLGVISGGSTVALLLPMHGERR